MIVRPLGFFSLVGIGVVPLGRRDFRKFVAAVAIGLTIGVLYMLPLARHFGDLLATENSYHSREWPGGWLLGFPFCAIITGTLNGNSDGTGSGNEPGARLRVDLVGIDCRDRDGEEPRLPRVCADAPRRNRVSDPLSLVRVRLP